MEQLLNRSSSISNLAFLRMLQLVHLQTSTLVEDVKQYDFPVIALRSPLDQTEFRRSFGGPPTSAAPSSSITPVSVMLETAMEELFAPYTEGQRYLEKESKCLTDLYAKHLSLFARYHVRVL